MWEGVKNRLNFFEIIKGSPLKVVEYLEAKKRVKTQN